MDGTVSLDLNDVTIKQALESILRPFDMSFIVESGTDEHKTVSMQLFEVPVREALRALGAAGGVDFRVDEGVVRVSESGRESVAIVPPLFGGVETATAIAEGVGDGLDISVVEGHVVVAGSKSDVKRFKDVAAELRDRPPGQWSVTCWIISMDNNSDFGLGVRGSPGVFASVLWGKDVYQTLYGVFFEVEGTAFGNTTEAQLLTKSSIVLVEGRKSEVGSTIETPIPRRSVSPQGTVQVIGYDYVTSGLLLTLIGTPIDNGLEVTLKPELSAVTGYVGDSPILAKRSTECTCLVRDGAVVVLSGMEELSDSGSWESPIFIGAKERGSRIVVIAHFTHIGY